MQTTVKSHMMNHQLSLRQFLRSSYMWKFSKDISDTALANDCKRFDEQGVTPPYATAYLEHVYGTR